MRENERAQFLTTRYFTLPSGRTSLFSTFSTTNVSVVSNSFIRFFGSIFSRS
jgi:hypothetical protein